MLTKLQMEKAFNLWMRRYLKDPAAFEAEFKTVAKFKRGGRKPSYGRVCASYLIKLSKEAP